MPCKPVEQVVEGVDAVHGGGRAQAPQHKLWNRLDLGQVGMASPPDRALAVSDHSQGQMPSLAPSHGGIQNSSQLNKNT